MIPVTAWPKHSFVAARLLGLRVRVPPETWKFVCCECCVLSGSGLCFGLIARPKESHRMCLCGCGWVCVCEGASVGVSVGVGVGGYVCVCE